MEQTKERTRQIFWAIIAIGIASPWIVGITVKLYLSAQGQPTLPLTYFLHLESLLIIWIPASIWWAIPYIGLAFFAHKVLSHSFLGLKSYTARVIFVSCGFLGGCVGTVIVFVGVFWEFDPLFLFLPLLWIYYPLFLGALLLLGLLFGFLIARSVQGRSLDQTN